MSESRAVIDRLTDALGARNDSDLARKLGTKPSTIGSWRTRDTIPYAECVSLSRREGFSLDWLLNGTGPRRALGPGRREPWRPTAERAETTGDAGALATLPLFDIHAPGTSADLSMAAREPPAAYGPPAPAPAPVPAAEAGAAFRFPAGWLRRVIGVEPGHAQVIVAEGTSLRPEVDPGDLLILDTDVDHRQPDGLYVFLLEGRVHVRTLHFLPGRTVRVVGRLPDYQDYLIDLSSAAPAGFALVARVALHGRVV